MDTIGFLSLRVTHSFFREALGLSGAERLGGSTDPPYKLDAVKTRTRARVEACINKWYQTDCLVMTRQSVPSMTLGQIFKLTYLGHYVPCYLL